MPSLPRARLADYQEQAGAIRFRIAHSTDISRTVSELKRRIPTWARSFDPATREWEIRHEYRDILGELFMNAPAGTRGQDDYADRRGRGQWAWIVLTLLVIAVAGALLWANPPAFFEDEPDAVAGATATAAAPRPTAAPVLAPQPARVTSAANLRAGPGTGYGVRATAAAGDSLTAVGKARGDDNYWWLLLDSGAWIRSDLVVSTAAGELPLDLSLIPEVPAQESAAPVASQESAAGQDGADGRVRATVTWVTDGDTIHVMIGGREYRVRYFGIDAPERDEALYEEAMAANSALVQGETLLLEAGLTDTDDYGRLLRYVFLEDGTLVQEELLRGGWGVTTYFPPDVRYRDRFLAAEQAAQAAGAGIWSN